MLKAISPLLLFIFSLFIPKTNAATINNIAINEFVSDTAGTTADPDWVEIYNNSNTSFNLGQYQLKDAVGNIKNLNGNLAPYAWAVFDWSNRLDKGGDTIYLREISTGTTIDSVQYGSGGVIGAPGPGQSAGRVCDGADQWQIFSSPTKGIANCITSPTPTFTITPTPTETPVPSETPTPTEIPAPTPTPTLEPTSTPTPTMEPTSTPTLGQTATPTPIAEPTSTPTSTPTLTPTPIPTPTLVFTPTPVATLTPIPPPSPTPCDWFCQRTMLFFQRLRRFLFPFLPFRI
jgi:hypothetical protein